MDCKKISLFLHFYADNILTKRQRSANISAGSRLFVCRQFCLRGLEHNSFGIKDETVVICSVYLVEKLCCGNKIAYCRSIDVLKHSKIALSGIDRCEHLLYVICAVILNAVILVFRNRFDEFLHLRSGKRFLIDRNRIGHIEIERTRIAIVTRLRLTVREIETASVQIGCFRFLAIKLVEILRGSLIHDEKIAVLVARFAVLEILRLIAGKSVSVRIFQFCRTFFARGIDFCPCFAYNSIEVVNF